MPSHQSDNLYLIPYVGQNYICSTSFIYVTYKMKTNFEVRQAKNEYDDDIWLPVVYYLNAWHYT